MLIENDNLDAGCWHIRAMLTHRIGATRRATVAKSQGNQDRKLAELIRALGDGGRYFVEFGYTGAQGSNTAALRRRGWRGLLLDGSRSDESLNLHRARISSSNIVPLLREHGVPHDASYISIDIDSFDLWVMHAILHSEYRPRIVSVEYNSNIPDVALAFPDPEVMHVPSHLRRWGGNCYMGSSALALSDVGRSANYSVVDVEPGFDLFLVPDELVAAAGLRPLELERNSALYYRPFNIGRDGGMRQYQRQEYIDYREWMRLGRSLRSTPDDWRAGRNTTRARRQAARRHAGAKLVASQHVKMLEARGVPCFVDGFEHDCKLLQKCDKLWSFLCRANGTDPCEQYGASGSWLAPANCVGATQAARDQCPFAKCMRRTPEACSGLIHSPV